MKTQTLNEMLGIMKSMERKLDVLSALDRDTTTARAYELTDQLTTMFETSQKMEAVIHRALTIVPG